MSETGGASTLCEISSPYWLLLAWEDLLTHNVVSGQHSWPAKDLKKAKRGKFPRTRCMETNLKAGQYSYRRGNNSRVKGYTRKGIKHSNKKVGIHQLAAWRRRWREPSPGQVASHWYCDNRKCCNPRHIIWETQRDNMSRHTCKIYGYRKSPNRVKGYRCPHKPTCRGCEPCKK